MLSFLSSARGPSEIAQRKREEGIERLCPLHFDRVPRFSAQHSTNMELYRSGRFSDFGHGADVVVPLHSDGLARDFHPDSPVDDRKYYEL